MSEEVISDQLSSEGQSQQQNTAIKKNKKINTKNKTKIILNISDCQYPVVSRVARKLGWKLQRNAEATDWDVFWTDNAVPAEVFSKMEPHQKINHFPGMFNLARKNLMGRYLMKMRKRFPDDYSFFPMTWMLPVQYHQLKSYFQTKQKGKARTFIVKPEALSQGKGIYLTRKLQQIDQNSHCVVQRYMHRPYLIEGLKFDMRVYVLVASVDPLRLYIYHEGLTRFATEKYQPPTKDNMEDVCMHLTNYAINKDNPKFVFNNSSSDMSKGHKRSLTWLFQYLQKNEPRSQNLKQKIEEMIVKTMISGLPPISNTYRSCQPQNYASNMCFQLLGFDVMLTEKCQPVLLQINHTPSFTTDTPLDDIIKTNYIRDSLLLMNINEKNKQIIIKDRKEACQQRVITGKKIKLTNQQKQIERKKAHNQRQKYESKNIGGFKKIYPIDDQNKMNSYQQFLNYSKQNFLILTGTKKGSLASKKNEKTEAAFGTCFKPKQNLKINTAKNRSSGIQIVKKNKTLQKKYETKKIIGESIESQKKKITHSQNLITPLSLGQTQEYFPKFMKDNSYQQQILTSNQSQQKQLNTLNLEGNKTYGQQNVDIQLFYQKQSEERQKSKQSCLSNVSIKRKPISSKQQIDIIHQNTQQSSRVQFFNSKSNQISKSPDDRKNKVKLNSTAKNYQNSQRQKDSSQKNIKNLQLVIDNEPFSVNQVTRNMNQQTLTACNQNLNNKADQVKLGLFGVNQITSDLDRKKNKTSSQVSATANIKGSLNIQNWESKPKQRHLCNREKIPIMLNTLLIGNSEGAKPALSANNLRKILNNQK